MSRFCRTTCHVFLFGVLMLVAIGAEEFPIAAVGRIIIVVPVLMMDFQQLKIAACKRSGTSSAHPWKKL